MSYAPSDSNVAFLNAMGCSARDNEQRSNIRHVYNNIRHVYNNNVYNHTVHNNTVYNNIVYNNTVYNNTRSSKTFNPLKPELNTICYLLALLGAHHFLHVSRIRVKLLIFRLLMSYIYIWSTHS